MKIAGISIGLVGGAAVAGGLFMAAGCASNWQPCAGSGSVDPDRNRDIILGSLIGGGGGLALMGALIWLMSERMPHGP